jgi:proteasome activator subunit 4
MVPVITSFLPPSHIHLYLPSLFKLWEAFNSSVLDERLIELAGELSEEHVAAKCGIAGPEGGAEWKDVGIWSEDEWKLLIGKGLGSMSSSLNFTTPKILNYHLIDIPVEATKVGNPRQCSETCLY